MKNNLEI